MRGIDDKIEYGQGELGKGKKDMELLEGGDGRSKKRRMKMEEMEEGERGREIGNGI